MSMNCTERCWGAGALVGAIVALVLGLALHLWLAPVLFGLMAWRIAGVAFVWLACVANRRALPRFVGEGAK